VTQLVENREPMIVELRFDAQRPRDWMRRAIRQIAADDTEIRIRWVGDGSRSPAGLNALLDLERMLLRGGRRSEADIIDPAAIGAGTGAASAPDVVVDFTDAPRGDENGPRLYLRPLYNGHAGENAVISAILSGDLPMIEIRDEISGAIVDGGHPSAEEADGLGGGLVTVMSRSITLAQAVMRRGPRPLALHDGNQPAGRRCWPAAYLMCSLVQAIALRIYRLCCYSPHWRIGWRHVDDDGIWARGDLSGPAWQVVRSPATNFYADPFPVTWQGRTFVFFEDLDHRVGKGIISAIEFGAHGPINTAIPVLEESWHLSYPFLLEFDGALWMIPESTANRDVTLYKCIEFPHRWERHTTLLSGLELADATIVRHGAFHYLFGATRDGAGGYSDTLSIYYADHPLGPWQPHHSNPVLLDRVAARPAGNFIARNGRLLRPAQDCSNGYGCALTLIEVDELSPSSFRQSIRKVIGTGADWPGRKLHTLNRSGRLEVIDGTTIQPRIKGLLQARSAGAIQPADSDAAYASRSLPSRKLSAVVGSDRSKLR
jgi:hypothetical protein